MFGKKFVFLITSLAMVFLTSFKPPDSSNKAIPMDAPKGLKEEIKYAATPTTGTHHLFEDICGEVEALVKNGTLPSFHLQYYKSPYYQIPYYKFKQDTELFNFWKGYTEAQIKSKMSMYEADQKFWVNFNKNLKVPIESLSRNQAVGMYFDGTQLNFIWSSEYLPIEGYNLQSITLNDVTYKQQEITGKCQHLNGDPLFETTTFDCYPEINLQLNMTPIAGFCFCKQDNQLFSYGPGLESTIFKVTGFSSNLDPFYFGVEYGKEDTELGTEYKIVSNDQKQFKFNESCLYQKNAMIQSMTHCYVEIADIECQSVFSLNFGGYEHAVYFNTDLNLDDIYRVDVNYSLASDQKPWYNFIAASGSMDVAKSLTPKTASGGFLGLSTYQGVKKGTFRFNEKEGKTYQYQLFLNYDADGWNIFKGGPDESKYTNVHNFKILRMNFLYRGQVLNCEIQMDCIDGNTLSIFDPKVISDVNSSYWQFKETVEDVKDNISTATPKLKTTFYVVIGVAGSILLIYVIYKVYILIKKVAKKE